MCPPCYRGGDLCTGRLDRGRFVVCVVSRQGEGACGGFRDGDSPATLRGDASVHWLLETEKGDGDFNGGGHCVAAISAMASRSRPLVAAQLHQVLLHCRFLQQQHQGCYLRISATTIVSGPHFTRTGVLALLRRLIGGRASAAVCLCVLQEYFLVKILHRVILKLPLFGTIPVVQKEDDGCYIFQCYEPATRKYLGHLLGYLPALTPDEWLVIDGFKFTSCALLKLQILARGTGGGAHLSQNEDQLFFNMELCYEALLLLWLQDCLANNPGPIFVNNANFRVTWHGML
ncbi:hypothetical protein EJB05_28758 [Eragrostis curvula]|uniref:Uncharacterized protein n=1 Tax=Eragrostis curvula TaxID=38414 RepID=A0A5J9USG1_9POAL|nr:hypothetical protein EJB05_28758 [Eragrostis curvula]